jgi:uncharacterized protein (DUF2141 family)
MLKVITVILMYLITIVSFAQGSKKSVKKGDHSVTAIIKNVSSDKGTVRFAIYNSEENYLKREFVAAESSEIKNGVAQVTFSGLEPSTYAIICYHDENENKMLDFQQNGMPTEDYGATNNVFVFGPPQFNDAKFELKDKDLTFEIKFM